MAANCRLPFVKLLYSVGGRVRLHESFAQAAVREVFEETGWTLEADRLLWTHESFFTLKGGPAAYDGQRFHEVSFFYLMKPNPDVLTDTVGRLRDNPDEWLEWVSIGELSQHTVFPAFFQTRLGCLPKTTEHIVTVE